MINGELCLVVKDTIYNNMHSEITTNFPRSGPPVIAFLNSVETYNVSGDGHLLKWSSCELNGVAVSRLIEWLSCQRRDWFLYTFVSIENTLAYTYGDWFKNPFGLFLVAKYSLDGVKATQNLPTTAPPINNYVCKTCGNQKCSKNEKSCWRCGTLIVP